MTKAPRNIPKYKGLYLDAMKQVADCTTQLHKDTALLIEAREQSQRSSKTIQEMTDRIARLHYDVTKYQLLSVACGIVTLLALAFAARVIF